MREAKAAGLTKQTYIWIVTQPVIGSDLDLAPQEFTEGMLGVHFDTSSKAMVHEIDTAVTVFGHALNTLHLDKSVTGWAKQAMVQPPSCERASPTSGEQRWRRCQSHWP